MARMGIHGIKGMALADIRREVDNGGRFVIYTYVVSILVLTFRRPTQIMWIPPHRGRFLPGLPYTLISMLAGWWGFPWGMIYTPMAIVGNCAGGKDVTQTVVRELRERADAVAARRQASAAAVTDAAAG